jgi:hypothetical protein
MSLEAPLPRPLDSNPQTEFDELLQTSVRERLRRARQADAALGSGELKMQVLCRYAAGELNGQEHQQTQGSVSRSRWALDRVAALVKGARTDGSLASRVLAAARAGEVDAGRVVALTALSELGRDDAVQVIDGGDPGALDGLDDTTPLIRAICQLGLGRRDAAREAFGSLDDLQDTAALARTIAAQDDPERALAEILDHL